MQTLLNLAYERSDAAIESEIMHKYLESTKKALEAKFISLIRQNNEFKQQLERGNYPINQEVDQNRIEEENSRTKSIEAFEEDKVEQLPVKPVILELTLRNGEKRKSHQI